METRLYYAYQTRYSDHLWVKPQDDYRDIAEACTSPSVVWLCRGIEAVSEDEARSIARERKAKGEGEVTHGGAALRNHGSEFPPPRDTGPMRPHYTGD